MRPVLLFALALLLRGPLPAFGQSHQVPAGPGNAVWLDSVQHLPLPQQVAAVQARVWLDTLLAPFPPPVCRVSLPPMISLPPPAPQWPASAALGAPLLYVVNRKPFYRNDAATTGALQRAIASRPIRQVTVLHAAAAATIYGSLAVNGAVVLSSAKTKKY